MTDFGAEAEQQLGLPSLEELVPLTQTLIPPALAALFFCRNIQFPTSPPAPQYCPRESTIITNDDDEEDAGRTALRTLKRPRLVWTPQLHRRFVEAVHQLGVKNAVPKSIMQIMNVDGLTRENVASHLQKYRLYLKRIHHHHHHHLPASGSPFIFPFPAPSPLTISSSSSANLTLIPQQPPQFLPFFSTKGH